MSLPEETWISDFYGRADHWGSVVRTIPGVFTCITTIGQGSTAKIAAACDDGTVRIYDSVTGALRLSLTPELPILEMTGLPDGSLLVCTHSGRPLITLWDIQTGGLVQTFILEGEARRTTVSLNGRYLACVGPANTVICWETASATQHPDFLEIFHGNIPCWLAPEELIAFVNWGGVSIHNVALKGPPIHWFEVPDRVHSIVYSHVFDRLIMCCGSYRGNSFTTHDVKTGTSSTSSISGKLPSFITLSQTAEQLLCGGEVPGLETVDISTERRTHFDFPATVTSASTLPNGTVVANFRGSGIQLLNLDQEHALPQQPTPPLRTMYPLDKGRIIATVPTTKDRITLLETATMSQVFSVSTLEGMGNPCRTIVLCASLEKKIMVCCSEGRLEMWEFSPKRWRWSEFTTGVIPTGSISPFCTRLVTFGNPGGSIDVRDASNGTLMAQKFIDNRPPLDITFDSEDRFYFYDKTHRVPYDIGTANGPNDFNNTHCITRCAKQRLDGQVLQKRYCLDDGCEWVFCGSRRICWVPSGYIGSTPDSHYWAGHSLVMIGQGGKLRKLTFPEPSL